MRTKRARIHDKERGEKTNGNLEPMRGRIQINGTKTE